MPAIFHLVMFDTSLTAINGKFVPSVPVVQPLRFVPVLTFEGPFVPGRCKLVETIQFIGVDEEQQRFARFAEIGHCTAPFGWRNRRRDVWELRADPCNDANQLTHPKSLVLRDLPQKSRQSFRSRHLPKTCGRKKWSALIFDTFIG